MRLVFAVGILALAAGGCGFGAGFRDEGIRQAGGIVAEEVADAVKDRLGDDFRELSEGLKDIPGKLPEPSSPVNEGLGYTLGALAAYIVGSLGKGLIRSRVAKRT